MKSANALKQEASRARKARDGLARVEVWVPVELVEQARRAVAELVEKHKEQK